MCDPLFGGVLKLTFIGLQYLTVNFQEFSSSSSTAGSLKLSMVGGFTTQKSANTANQKSLPLFLWLTTQIATEKSSVPLTERRVTVRNYSVVIKQLRHRPKRTIQVSCKAMG